MPRKYTKKANTSNEAEEKDSVLDNAAKTSENTSEDVSENVEPKIKKGESLQAKKNDEVPVEELFKVQRSTNAVIDGELNRIWGYLKVNSEKEKRITELCNTLDSIIKDTEKFKEEIRSDAKKNLEEAKKSSADIDIKSIIDRVSKELFSSKEFMEMFTAEVLKEIRKTNKISLLYEGRNIHSARFEFGFAKKGAVVFFNKAFTNILWHLPAEITMVTNTGFVALKDSFWIVVGEDAEEVEG